MSGIKDIRKAMATALENLPTLNQAIGDYKVSAYPQAAPKPPTVEISNFSVIYHAGMGRIPTQAKWLTCIVRGYLAVASSEAAQEKADEFFEEDVLADAIETADETLGGLVSGLIVERADQRFWDHPTLTSLIVGGEWQVRILR